MLREPSEAWAATHQGEGAARRRLPRRHPAPAVWGAVVTAASAVSAVREAAASVLIPVETGEGTGSVSAYILFERDCYVVSNSLALIFVCPTCSILSPRRFAPPISPATLEAWEKSVAPGPHARTVSSSAALTSSSSVVGGGRGALPHHATSFSFGDAALTGAGRGGDGGAPAAGGDDETTVVTAIHGQGGGGSSDRMGGSAPSLPTPSARARELASRMSGVGGLSGFGGGGGSASPLPGQITTARTARGPPGPIQHGGAPPPPQQQVMLPTPPPLMSPGGAASGAPGSASFASSPGGGGGRRGGAGMNPFGPRPMLQQQQQQQQQEQQQQEQQQQPGTPLQTPTRQPQFGSGRFTAAQQAQQQRPLGGGGVLPG